MEKLEKLKQIIQESNQIVFFGGAGVSTESNIPDFRSKTGLYKKNTGSYPAEVMLSRTFFDHHKKAFYDFYLHEMIYPNALPNVAHIALANLEKKGKLQAVITQNIDGLHQKAGSCNVIELHGSIKRNYCINCKQFYTELDILNYQGICPFCGGYIKPDVVLYEEPLDNYAIEQAIHYITQADVLIVGGTSLSVYPATSLIRYFKGNYLVIINQETTPFDQLADLVIHDSIGTILSKIV